MGIKAEKIKVMKLIMECNNPIIIRKVREILEKGLNKKSSTPNKIKKDIK
ncbi:hypothetical protein FLA105534_02186 [Flavobacterium bizetiae]|jgi:hypothetical protein|uniref:Uncharacterized protein n=1 Tax=Flavobacterium bizetiae TaxID=2704140 RepID=A0A6J4GJV7_9FLAO|nr:hypothetical protein [Flavobacterium piscis]CAA9198545.1 hypothetical protein FLA105534_02186 [Flavobacterium bizetiae]CAD5341145.1 hypothetical protein FLA105535_01108 [Flavobacterium bizetiae]CAD5347174.1 hypothetical protein FLA105534_01128 [Flavobacterium bizetiae]